MPKGSLEIEIGGHELTVEFTYTPITPAQVWGPPEHCYPEEGGELEIDAIKILAIPSSKTQKAVFLDITDLITECGGADHALELLEAKIDQTDFYNDYGADYDPED